MVAKTPSICQDWGCFLLDVAMKRIIMCVLLCILGVGSAWAQEAITISPGKDFTVYEKPKPTNATPDRVELVYFYWYGSPWAKEIDRDLRTWANTRPYGVKLIPAPAAFGSKHEIFGARIFFALELLGKEEEISPLLLEAVSQRRLNFDSIPAIVKWMDARGVPEKDFLKAMDDPRTKASTARVQDVMKIYGIKSVPTVVINGKYVVRAYDKVPPDRFLKIVKVLTQRLSETGQKR